MSWIACDERLPEDSAKVLVCERGTWIQIAQWLPPVDDELEDYRLPWRWQDCGEGFILKDITHWMPLPPTPTPERRTAGEG